MREEYYSLPRFQSGVTCPFAGSLCAMLMARYPASRSLVMSSSMTEEAIHLPPTPEPHERVVFIPHFARGLGFPLHLFFCGLMFYYGLDFHDLAPNLVLNISTFIVVCEAFLRIHPHFGKWLKIFNVKPKIVSGQQAECGGAMVGKMPNITWLEGSFVETVKGWQSGWFYITESRDAN